MNRKTMVLIILALVGGLVGGFLLASQQGAAFAQENAEAKEKPPTQGADKEKPVDVKALLAPAPVVAAVPYATKTDYEQDPFEPTRLRRTTSQVERVLLVHQDGMLEVKEAP